MKRPLVFSGDFGYLFVFMQESVAKPTKPFVGFWRKTGIVFLLAIAASAIRYFLFENSAWPQSSSGWSAACAFILGGALFYFVVAMVFAAWIRGVAGAVVGGLIVAGLCYFSWSGEYEYRRPEREFVSTLQKDQQAVKDSFKEHVNDFGGGTTDLKTVDSMLGDLKNKSKDLEPQDKAAAEAMAVVMDQFMAPIKAARPLSDEIFSEKFQDVGSIRTLDDVDERLGKIEAFRSLSGKALSMCQNLDVTLKQELLKRNLSATYINQCTASFMKGARMDITLPFAQVNVELGDILARHFALLKQEFGHWKVKNKIVYLEHSQATKQWNDDIREYFQVAEKREKLTRELAGTQ